MPAFVIFVEGADTEPAKIPVYIVESEEHASLICEGMKESDYQIFDFSFKHCTRSDRGKFAVWATMVCDAREGVYGNIVGGIYKMIDGAYSVMSGRRSREKIVSGADTENGNGGSTPTAVAGEGKVKGSQAEAAKPDGETPQGEELQPSSSDEKDNALPAKQRKLSPSRIKAKATYEWAMAEIPGAEDMTIAELYNAIECHPSNASDALPPNSETFGKYLRDAGVKIYSTGADKEGGSIRRADEI